MAPLPPFGDAWVLLEWQYYDELPPAEVRMRGAVRGMLETLDDPYTVLLDPQPAQQEQYRLSGRYGDIGLELWWAEEGAVGLSPYPAGPAELAGIAEGDRLLSIDGEAVGDAARLDALAGQLRGEIDTPVTLTVHREPDQTLTFTITRAEVLRPSVQSRHIPAAGGDIGYMRVTNFTERTVEEATEHLARLKRHGVQTLILDVRDNGGGLVEPLRRMAGLFLPSGTTIYYEIDRHRELGVQVLGQQKFAGPMVILVNRGTASATEIFAAALRENDRATIIGEPTFGKSSIQELYPLNDGSTLYITTAVWLTPEQHRLDGVGLTPDVSISPQVGQDAALQAALAHLEPLLP